MRFYWTAMLFAGKTRLTHMKLLFRVLAAAALLVPSLAPAGDAFFSADGNTVTFLPRFKAGIIWQLEVASGKLKALPLPKELKGAAPTGIARGGEGEMLLTAGSAAWVVKEDGTAKRICDLGPAKEPQNLFTATAAGSPVADWLFVSATEADDSNRLIFYGRKPGTKAFEKVFCRRVENVRAGAFTEDGRLFFAADGDLWEGSFDPEGGEPGMPVATLIGARMAPVGTLNTDGANGGGMFVDAIAPAGKWIYVGLRGHHMGAILRVPVAGKPLYSDAEGTFPEPQAHLQAMSATLAKTEVLVENAGSMDAFAACEVDGKPMVFYRGDNDDEGLALWLWTSTGKPRRLATEPQD